MAWPAIGATGANVLPSWRDDAELHDVFFVDHDYGWAVGDHGTIWHTQNGGEIWRLQSTAEDASLRDIHFLDRQHGWAVGGRALPLTARSQGVVLQTNDGGRTWTSINSLLLPWLNGVHFASTKTGMAFGHASSNYPGGVWKTADGGRTWSPLPGTRGVHWLHGEFQLATSSDNGTNNSSDYFGALRGHDGQVARLFRGRVSTVAEGSSAWFQHPFVAPFNPQVLFAGTNSLTLSTDGGKHWHAGARFTPDRVEQQMRWQSMPRQQHFAWLAGQPGTRILKSEDFGQSWTSHATPTYLPLHKLHFASATHGWAVGAKGTILATKDAGETWERQRSGRKRDAVLVVAADERSIPWRFIANAAAMDEYRTHIIVVSAADTSARSSLVNRLQFAASRVGASVELLTPDLAQAFDVMPSDLLKQWSVQSQDSSASNVSHTSQVDRLAERITRAIRERRPEVVLTTDLPSDNRGAQRLVAQLVADACDYAESEQAYPAHRLDFGLGPWRVSRALRMTEKPGVAMPHSQRTTGLGAAPEDLARYAQQIMGTADVEASWTLRSLRGSKTGSSSAGNTSTSGPATADLGTQVFAGVVVEYNSAARRPRAAPVASKVAASRLALGMARTHRKVGMTRVEQMESIVGQDPFLVGQVLFNLSEQEIDSNERDLLLQELVTRYPQHPLADAALIQLVRHHTSLEAQWRAFQEGARLPATALLADVEVSQDGVVSQDGPADLVGELDAPVVADLKSPEFNSSTSKSLSPATLQAPAIQEEDAEAGSAIQLVTAEEAVFQPNWRLGYRLQQEILAKRPSLSSFPEVVFPLASLPSELNPQANSSRWQQQIMPNGWPEYARFEKMLLGVEGDQQSSAIWSCPAVVARPHLDGLLNDATWQDVEFQPLQASASTGVKESPCHVGFANDGKFLYVAVVCPKVSGFRYTPPRKQRPRDGDLSEHDRVEIRFDINRDYSSWWSYTFDDRGWTNDALGQDLSWDPAYYVALASDEQKWVIETAIPLDSLAPDEYRHSTYWAIGVERTVPRQRVERWSPMATHGTGRPLHGILHME